VLRSPSGPEQVHLCEDVAGADEAPTLARRPGRTPLGNRERGCGGESPAQNRAVLTDFFAREVNVFDFVMSGPDFA
jgi:hypothetical protein